jgi:hypothetical protein
MFEFHRLENIITLPDVEKLGKKQASSGSQHTIRDFWRLDGLALLGNNYF